MNLTDKKIWGSLSLDKIKEAKAKAPKKFTQSDTYGSQLVFDAKQWDDGGITLSVSYKDESDQWQRIAIGNIRLSKDQTGAKPAAAASPFGDESPF